MRRSSLSEALGVLRDPIPPEKKRLLAERWQALDPRWRTPAQGFGQQATGCGATIGVQPRCDFDCTGCYLGSEANTIKPFSLEDVFAQLETLRAHLGPKGNVQITDGEVTLVPEDDLIRILRRARALGLIPMVMTHGDSFRRRPHLLRRLMQEGRLTEVSIHVDTTQRGRVGYKHVTDEDSLRPLREEFAEMIRAVRVETGLTLRAAMTMTITRENLPGVPGVVEWCLRNCDAFGMLSFQPLARVGRTQDSLSGVTVAELWDGIDPVLAAYGLDQRGPGPLRFGHPECSRIEAMGVYQHGQQRPRLFPIVREDDARDGAIMREFLARGFGGINFRDDPALHRILRTLGVLLKAPGFFLVTVPPWLRARVHAMDMTVLGLIRDALGHRVRLGAFSVVSHHFMSPEELSSELGKERLEACVFRLPIDGEMVPMCRVNAGGVRESAYARGTSGLTPARPEGLLEIRAS